MYITHKKVSQTFKSKTNFTVNNASDVIVQIRKLVHCDKIKSV